jgi:hypothetical protein
MTALMRRATCLAATTLLAAGCTTVLTGNAIKDPAVDTQAPNPALLDPGNYPTAPAPPLGTAGTPRYGAALEAHRIGENTVFPFQVDSALTRGGPFETGPFIDPSALTLILPGPVNSAPNVHNFVAGFITQASTTEATPPFARDLTNIVLRFAAPPDAAAAAADMAARSANVSALFSLTPIPTAPVPVPGHPDTAAVTYPGPSGTNIVLAYTARGPYVLTQSVTVINTPDAAAALAGVTLDQQEPLIDGLTATPPDQLSALPVDPDALLARAVPLPGQPLVAGGSFGPHAVLVFMDDPPRSEKVFTTAGVDVIARANTIVYRARDDAGAAAIIDDFSTEVRKHLFTPIDGVLGLPAARCLTSPPRTSGTAPPLVYCAATVGRTAFEASGTQETDVRQRMAAQYLMLTAP